MGGNLHRRDRTELNRFLDPLDRFWSASRAAPEIQGDPADRAWIAFWIGIWIASWIAAKSTTLTLTNVDLFRLRRVQR